MKLELKIEWDEVDDEVKDAVDQLLTEVDQTKFNWAV